MATVTPGIETSFTPSQHKKATPENYVDLTTLLDLSKVDFPDIYNQLVQPFGDQSLMDFCRMIGSHRPLAANTAQWFEEARLHNAPTGTVTTSSLNANAAVVTVTSPAADLNIRVNDVVLDGEQTALVTAVAGDNTNFTIAPYDNWVSDKTATATTFVIIGNDYVPGSDQPAEFIESGLVLRETGTMILKDNYKLNGSQATNRAWIPVPKSHPSGGGWVWGLKNEGDQRKRYENYQIMSMLLGQPVTSNSTITNLSGTEGVVSAIKSRGINSAGAIAAEADMDAIVLALARVRADNEYTVWQSTDHALGMDKMLASVSGAAPNASYGIFGNSQENAVNLGFASYKRNRFTFHLKGWDLLDDPTLLGAFPDYLKALFIPGGQRLDGEGMLTSAFNVRYKEEGGYSRAMEHWLTGSGSGVKTNGMDYTSFEYRSEIAAQIFGANRFIRVTG